MKIKQNIIQIGQTFRIIHTELSIVGGSGSGKTKRIIKFNK